MDKNTECVCVCVLCFVFRAAAHRTSVSVLQSALFCISITLFVSFFCTNVGLLNASVNDLVFV